MKRRNKEINIFSMSALDLFASALGAFILIAIVLFPYFPNIGDSPERITQIREDLRAAKAQRDQAEAELEAVKAQRNQAASELAKTKQELAQIKFPHLDLVVALDITGSMGPPLEGLKQELGEMVQILSRLAPSLGVGIVAFNDRAQYPVVLTSQLQTVTPRSTSFNKLQNFINSLAPGVASGDNVEVPEAVYQALQQATAMPWRPEAEKKIIVVITDAPPYADEYAAAIRIAKQFASGKGQSVSGVWCDHYPGYYETSDFLQELSKEGQGHFIKAGGSMTSSILLALLNS